MHAYYMTQIESSLIMLSQSFSQRSKINGCVAWSVKYDSSGETEKICFRREFFNNNNVDYIIVYCRKNVSLMLQLIICSSIKLHSQTGKIKTLNCDCNTLDSAYDFY